MTLLVSNVDNLVIHNVESNLRVRLQNAHACVWSFDRSQTLFTF